MMKDIDIMSIPCAEDIYNAPKPKLKPNDYDAGYNDGYADGKIEALKNTVEIVRCRDCAFCDTGKYYGICHKTGTAVDLNGFCSWGIHPKEETE